MTSRILAGAVAVLALAAVSGCTHLTPPPRFLVVEDWADNTKAVTPEDSRLWLRVFDDDDEGGLPFWKDALREDLIKNRGYVLVSEGEASAGALKGVEFILETTVNGKPVRELLTLFVTQDLCDDHVHVIEYVADKDVFEKELPEVRQSIAGYQP